MALNPGTRIGPYEITAPLGAGGMGEVYRARDTKLGREVAIKVLPDHLVGDPERVARLEREAQALAALNHPNIAQIYGTEGHAIVMELVPGDDLAARIRRGPIAAADALPIATQIAHALEAAHALSIIHRDLKPANIKVNADGAVKVLDFGLARIGAPDASGEGNPSNSPTMTSPATALGVILGTAAYMAPEQARGRAVDKRADIWAFGCVLYEMITGKPAFGGDTVTDVLAAVVTKEPDWSALPAATPRSVRTVLTRCLQKDPKQRLRDIGDARLELETGDALDSGVAAALQSRARMRWVPLALTALAAAILGAGAGVGWRASRETPTVEWTATRLGGPAIAFSPSVSPDGHLVAFLAMVDGQSQVAVMKPSAGASWNAITRDRTRGIVQTASWSADGSAIYYDRITDVANGIYSVAPLGGDERLVLENAAAPTALPDGTLLFIRLNRDRISQLHRFWPASGKIDALPVVSFNRAGMTPLVAVLDETRAVVSGLPAGAKTGPDLLHVLNMGSGELRPIGRQLGDGFVLSLALDRSTGTVLAAVVEGSMCRVMRIWPDDSTPPAHVLTLLELALVHVGRNGELVASLATRPTEIVRADFQSGAVERLITRPMPGTAAIELQNGGILVGNRLAAATGGDVLIAPPGREPYRFVQSDDRTRSPMTMLPDGRVALMIGSGLPPDLAIVASDTGRVLNRIKFPADPSSLAASPDGRTIYYAAAGMISAVSVDGGTSRAICPGESMTVDPADGTLIVRVEENERGRLMRCPLDGGSPQEIQVRGDVRIASALAPHSIRGGRLLLTVASPDSWYWHAGVLDLATGVVQRIKVNHMTDFAYVNWTPDGKVLGTGIGIKAAIWKFEKKK